MTDDYLPSYETLLTSTEMTSMQIRQMHNLCVEIYIYITLTLKSKVHAGTF